MIARILTFNVVLFVALLFVIEIVLQVSSPSTYTDRKARLSGLWKWPANESQIIKGPLTGLNIAHPYWGFQLNPERPEVNRQGF